LAALKALPDPEHRIGYPGRQRMQPEQFTEADPRGGRRTAIELDHRLLEYLLRRRHRRGLIDGPSRRHGGDCPETIHGQLVAQSGIEGRRNRQRVLPCLELGAELVETRLRLTLQGLHGQQLPAHLEELRRHLPLGDPHVAVDDRE
jgi:hypothetical protein